ncbi:triose-phosphate isomerase [bacterium]|nr:triose-phosphate isomerase [bacterium]
MPKQRRLMIAGNWKMNLSLDEAVSLSEAVAALPSVADKLDVAIFPPAVYIERVASILGKTQIFVGAQNIHPAESGAFTGEISAKMVLTTGGTMVILGHSERRHIFGESDEYICAKLKRAVSSGLTSVLCIGEKLDQRRSGKTFDVLESQLRGSLEGVKFASDDLILAYEPVWAIGTGQIATPEQAEEVHAFIREWMAREYGDSGRNTRILYGGSVKPDNAFGILEKPDVDGALVGGASLKSDSFWGIISEALKVLER